MTDSNSFFRVYMPYCLIPTEDGRWLVANREYQALGESRYQHTDYRTDPSIRAMKISHAARKKIDYHGEAAAPEGRIYLYNDGCRQCNRQSTGPHTSGV